MVREFRREKTPPFHSNRVCRDSSIWINGQKRPSRVVLMWDAFPEVGHTAVLVAPPWRVARGRHWIRTASRVNAGSLALADHRYASPEGSRANCSGDSDAGAALAFWMRFSQAGELKRCRMICVDNSISATGTDGGFWLATKTLVPLCRISLTIPTRPATSPGFLCACALRRKQPAC